MTFELRPDRAGRVVLVQRAGPVVRVRVIDADRRKPMKLWILARHESSMGFCPAWTAVIVRAEDEDDARRVADEHVGYSNFWATAVATCERLTEDGEPGVILG